MNFHSHYSYFNGNFCNLLNMCVLKRDNGDLFVRIISVDYSSGHYVEKGLAGTCQRKKCSSALSQRKMND